MSDLDLELLVHLVVPPLKATVEADDVDAFLGIINSLSGSECRALLAGLAWDTWRTDE